MTKFVTDLRNSFWFVPTLIVLVCAGLAVAAVELDGIVGDDALLRFPRLFGAGAEGARELLSVIAGSTITVAGVVFSITIVALSLTAAQYSPRVLRSFMGDRANQIVLGAFVGIYVYCLLVLRTVRGGDEGFVPGISIVGSLLLALIGVGVLIFFIHHIALSIQVSHIAARVAEDTIAALRESYPPEAGNEGRLETLNLALQNWHCLSARESGYIQNIDMNSLLEVARTKRLIVRVNKAVGEFVIRGNPLLEVSGSEAPGDELRARLLSAIAINTYRDIVQDPEFGVQQLVDIALKALSPGVNDIGTARNVLHHITAIVCELARRSPEEHRYFYEDGKLALIKSTRGFEEIVDAALAPIRRNALDKPDMIVQLFGTLEQIAHASRTREQRAVVAKQAQALHDGLDAEGFAPDEAETIERALQTVLSLCEPRAAHARRAGTVF